MIISMGKGRTAILAMAIAAAGTFAPAAHAKRIGAVNVKGSSWGTAWNQCRKQAPKTKSVKNSGVTWQSVGRDGKPGAMGTLWYCYDTTRPQ
jgi:hypothetical protein